MQVDESNQDSSKRQKVVSGKLIKDQTDISGLTTINYKEPTWRSTTLLCHKAIGIANAKNLRLRRLGALSVKYE